MSYTPRFQSIIAERRSGLQQALEEALRDGPEFVWEVGCGHGHFLTAYAAAHPEKRCIGVDLIADRIARAERKRDRASLSNLHFIQAEARLFLETLPKNSRIAAIFILFPDPWPKQRHNKHRILQSSFLTAAADHAKPDARLYFRTDYRPYFDSARTTIAASHDWDLVDESWPFEFQTVFQQRADTHHSLIARCKSCAQQG